MINLQETTSSWKNIHKNPTLTHGRVLRILEDPTKDNLAYDWLEFESLAHRNVFLDLIRIGHSLNYTHISEATIPDLFNLSRDVIQWKQVNTIMNVGIWGIQSSTSIVLPSYILGWLGYLRHVHTTINKHHPNCSSRLRIHLWMSEAIEFNGYDAEKTQIQSLKTIFILKSFIKKYFPDLVDLVDFDYLLMDDEIKEQIEQIEQNLNSMNEQEVQNLIAVFRKMWEKHGWEEGKKNALKYAVSHIYWLQDLFHDKGINKAHHQYDNPYYISLWWKAERNFNHLRVLIRTTLLWQARNPNHVHLTSDMYLKPPYYEDPKWDILFERQGVSPQAFDGFSKDRQVQLEQICKICNISPEEYLHFVSDVNLKITWLEKKDLLWSITTDLKLERNSEPSVAASHTWKYKHLKMDEINISRELEHIEHEIKWRRFLPHDFDVKKSTPEGQIELIKRGTADFIGESELTQKIKAWKKLIIKLWIDPTWDEIHIGHLIPLKKLHLFQALWHEIRFLIGTFTATIGDPDKKSTREVLSEEQINKNIETYILQVRKVIDLDSGSAKIVYNKDWYGTWTAADLLGLAMKWKIGQMLQKEQFKERMKDGGSIAIWEFIYPLLQWWDSVVLNSDVELGGQDQLFNLYRWRDLQASQGQSAQAVITTPLLNGFDGLKMSKTYNNFVGMKPEENLQHKVDKDYWKIMSMNDEQMLTYFSYVVSTSEDEVEFIEKAVKSWLINPILVKKMLARCILGLFYEDDMVKSAESEFEQVFSKKQAPSDIVTMEITYLEEWFNVMSLLSLVKENNVSLSGSEIRRRVQWWAISVNNEKITDINTVFDFKVWDKVVLKYGKWKFIQFIIK